METVLLPKRRTANVQIALTPINNIQQMWDTTVEYFTAGLFDTDAMYKVYKAMNPKLTFQDIANVFSGVYADTYWNVTLMDSSVLSKSMQSALGLSKDLADRYSNIAISQWRGILCRKNINDTGTIPVSGDYTSSLDIVCNQNTELDPTQLIENWNSTFWQTPQVGKNYVYTRCQNTNFRNNITTQVVNMFFTSGGFNQPPTAWQQLFTAANSAKDGVVLQEDGKTSPMALGARGASEAFFFNPTTSDHVCIIAIVATEFFTNPLNVVQGNWNSQQWITHNGAAAWHNVNPQALVQEALVFFNQDPSQKDFSFVANCRNVPVGSKIGLKSADDSFAFDSRLVTITNSAQQVEHQVTVPAYYKGKLLVTMQGPDGGLLPENAAVEVTMGWRLKQGHKHYLNAINQSRGVSLLNGQALEVNLGSYTFEGSKTSSN